jgi:hypothetical protein
MLDLFEELKDFITELSKSKKEYALCGGLALAVYGVTRATIDIDILIARESLPEVLSITKKLGYRFPAAPMKFKGGTIEIHRVSKIDPETKDLFSLDCLVVTSAIESIWEGRRQVKWEGKNLWVVSRDGLIALKLRRGSGQDLDDIQKLKEIPNES